MYKFMDAVGNTDCNHYFQVGPQEPNLPDPGRSQQDAVSMKRSMLLSEQAVGVAPLPSWETVPVSEHDQTLISHY